MPPGDYVRIHTIAPAEGRRERKPPLPGGVHDVAIACNQALIAEAESAEVEPNNDAKTATTVTVGSVVSGHTDPQQRDYYRFAAKKGDRAQMQAVIRNGPDLRPRQLAEALGLSDCARTAPP